MHVGVDVEEEEEKEREKKNESESRLLFRRASPSMSGRRRSWLPLWSNSLFIGDGGITRREKVFLAFIFFFLLFLLFFLVLRASSVAIWPPFSNDDADSLGPIQSDPSRGSSRIISSVLRRSVRNANGRRATFNNLQK